ncbi:MAG: SGNH/GDSL hydrolase family protein [Cyclobacteriaceae bacterium]
MVNRLIIKVVGAFVFIIMQFPAMAENTLHYPDPSEVRELVARDGLPNFFAKALGGDSVKVAYLGGSITAQPGWRVFSLEWLQQQYPKAAFSEINAAIGGTGSDFGVFRLHEQVLRFNPDLVFVEFAVNDGSTPAEKITRSMEGIVRQIWEQNPAIDICFVYTLKDSYLEKYLQGQLPPSAVTMEKVADHYGIPSINFGVEVNKQVQGQQLIFEGKSQEIDGVPVFSPDGVHPYPETGHRIYQQVIQRALEAMAQPAKPKKHRLPKPLTSDYFSNTQMLDIPEAALSKNWDRLAVDDHAFLTKFDNYLSEVTRTGKSGETLTLRFKGRTIGAYDIMGPGAGKVIVEVDGVVQDTLSRFDAYCTYWRMNYFLIDHLEDQEHEVVFRVLAEPFDKAAILAKRDQVMENPTDYEENSWYVGKIMLDGELLK